MTQMQEGLFSLTGEEMPCSPKAIAIPRYLLPGALGRAKQEEAAARILSFSNELDQWVGVSWTRVLDMMTQDFATEREINAAIEAVWTRNDAERERVGIAMMWYVIFCVLTVGIYAIFTTKPAVQMQEMPKKRAPFSGIYTLGARHVITGINELIEKGLLRCVREGDGEDAIDVFFPTPELVSRIMRAQGVAA